jgi:DNA-binding protein HU-beta
MGTKLTAAPRAQADKRAAMIAEAAYFIAERRNFQPGDELSDWLAAEQAVEASLGSARQARTRGATQSAATKPGKKKVSKATVKKAEVRKAPAKTAGAKKATAKKATAKKATKRK